MLNAMSILSFFSLTEKLQENNLYKLLYEGCTLYSIRARESNMECMI